MPAAGARMETGDGTLRVIAHGRIAKLVERVDQITFSGPQACIQGQQIVYVTERAVFELREDGVHLAEIAPGIDLQNDVLDRMGFVPRMNAPPAVMSSSLFRNDFGQE